ncbi:MAG: shikimate dehydrogenase [Desulfofustis sp.]|jgi:shikimate dehydrogenase
MKNELTAPMNITGETRVYVVVGDPIRQVRSTELYNKLATDKGLDVVFIPLHFSAADSEAAIAGFRVIKNLDGIIPTIPHKPAFLKMVDELTPRARMVGAVNSIRCMDDGHWLGDIFDGVGYVNGLLANGRSPAGKSVLLIGSGGAGSSMAFALAEAGVSRLLIFDTVMEKAERVAAGVARYFPAVEVSTGAPDPRGFDIVANATPVGMELDDPFPINPELLTPRQLVTEMIMQPEVTKFLQAARNIGCDTQVGYEALKGQAQANMEFFGLQ